VADLAEHLLDDLDVSAGGDGQAGGGVAKLVRVQAGQPDRLGGAVERSAAEDRSA
jgi:hypothetical protein